MRYLLTLLMCLPLSAATLYVAPPPTGNDTTGNGSSGSPWATINKAASVVNPGDTVYVAAGTYTEYVQLTRPGTSVAPITWIGERDGDDWLTIIDGSEAMPQTGWTQATGAFTDGQRAWKRTFSYQPGLITINGLSMLEMRWSVSAQRDGYWNLNKLGYASNRTTGDGIPKNGTALWWAGFESMWAYTNGIVYVRFRDESTPVGKTMRVSPRAVAWNINGANYNTIRGFNIRGARQTMHWINDVQGVVVEQCLFEQGHKGILGTGHTRDCIVRDNLFRGLHASVRPYGPRRLDNPDHNVEYQMYSRNKFEWGLSTEGGAIEMFNPGVNIFITNNVLTNIAIGVLIEQGNNRPNQARDASGMEINFNTMRDMTHAILLGAGHGNVTVASNTIHRAHYAMRFQNFNVVPAVDGTYWVYGNRISSTNYIGRGVYMHAWPDNLLGLIGNPDTTASGRQKMWMYHNSFSGMQDGLYVSYEFDTSDGLPRWYVVNNLFSSQFAMRGTSPITPMQSSGLWGALDYNAWKQRTEDSKVISDAGPNNVVLADYEWPVSAEPDDWIIVTNSSARAAGIDISDTFTVKSVIHSALPGYSPGYFETGLGPDIGATQYFSGGVTNPPDYPLVSVAATDSQAHESTLTTGTFTLTRTESLSGTLTINYVISGTATAGLDYVDDLGTSITFADGEGSTNITVTPLSNGGYFGNQTVIITLSADESYLLRQPISATIIIVEGNDQPGALTRPPAPGHAPATRRMRL